MPAKVWLTVGGVLGEAESWTSAGHEIAWVQERVQPTAPLSHWGGYNRPNGTLGRFEAARRDGTAPGNETGLATRPSPGIGRGGWRACGSPS